MGITYPKASPSWYVQASDTDFLGFDRPNVNILLTTTASQSQPWLSQI